MQSNYTLLPQGEAEPLHTGRQWKKRRPIWQWVLPGLLAAAVLVAVIVSKTRGNGDRQSFPHSSQPACPQFPVLKALSSERETLEKEVKDEINSSEFLEMSVKRMQGAVQIPTESFDDMKEVGKDPRWDIFVDFHAYLKKTFPLVYAYCSESSASADVFEDSRTSSSPR